MKRDTVIFRCDSCSKTTESPVAGKWFNILALEDLESGKEDSVHMCKKCGHDLMSFLTKMNINYAKECTQYEIAPSEMGWIAVDLSGGVEARELVAFMFIYDPIIKERFKNSIENEERPYLV